MKVWFLVWAVCESHRVELAPCYDWIGGIYSTQAQCEAEVPLYAGSHCVRDTLGKTDAP